MGAAEVAAGVKAANEFYKLAEKQGWIDRIKDFLKKKHVVLLLGNTGVGKTEFLESLTKELPKAIHHLTRTTFAYSKKIKIQDAPFDFRDTPGQKEHRSKRKTAIQEAIADKVEGAINVVSYGYHEYAIGSEQAVTKDRTPKVRFLEAHRNSEIAAVAEWGELITVSGAKWLLTVVTKADLWFDKQQRVMRHYESGPYAEALGSLQSIHSAAAYCSVFHKFYGEVPLCGAFDDEDRQRGRAHVLMTLFRCATEKR